MEPFEPPPRSALVQAYSLNLLEQRPHWRNTYIVVVRSNKCSLIFHSHIRTFHNTGHFLAFTSNAACLISQHQ